MAKAGKTVKMQWFDGNEWVDITDSIDIIPVSDLEEDIPEYMMGSLTITFSWECEPDAMLLLRLQAEMYAETFRN